MGYRTIEIDKQVFEELQRRAEPLVDDANAVLRKVLGLPASAPESRESSAAMGPSGVGAPQHLVATRAPITHSPKPSENVEVTSSRAPRGQRLPRSEYELPILETLVELGGSAASSIVVELAGKKLQARLTSIDYETIQSGEVRWENVARFARLHLREIGQIASDSPHGTWEVTQAGRDRVASQRGDQEES